MGFCSVQSHEPFVAINVEAQRHPVRLLHHPAIFAYELALSRQRKRLQRCSGYETEEAGQQAAETNRTR